MEPIYGRITCRKNFTVFADGEVIARRDGDFREAMFIEVPALTKVVGVECSKQWTGGILAAFTNGFVSDRDWMCSTDDEEENWNMVSDSLEPCVTPPKKKKSH